MDGHCGQNTQRGFPCQNAAALEDFIFDKQNMVTNASEVYIINRKQVRNPTSL
jgi:hypothetical protein